MDHFPGQSEPKFPRILFYLAAVKMERAGKLPG